MYDLKEMAEKFLKEKQYNKLYILNDIYKDIEINKNVFMEPEINRLDDKACYSFYMAMK